MKARIFVQTQHTLMMIKNHVGRYNNEMQLKRISTALFRNQQYTTLKVAKAQKTPVKLT